MLNRGSGSGMSKPTPIPYPSYQPVAYLELLRGTICYVVGTYLPGISVIISQGDGAKAIQFADWNGVLQPPTNLLVQEAMRGPLAVLLDVMQLIKLPQAQFYFGITNGELVLADIRQFGDSLVSPGLVRDLFGNAIKTQRIFGIKQFDQIKTLTFDDLEGMVPSDYQQVIIKPSKFSKVDGIDNSAPYVNLWR
jgi:hypothetical protein